MNKKTIFLIISVLIIFIAGGCTKRQCVEADFPTFQPILDSPADGGTVSVDGPWTFDWHHDEPCEPFSYLVRIYDSDNHAIFGERVWGPTSELTVDLDYFIPPKENVYPGTEYFWNVLPEIEQELPAKVSELKDDGQISQTFSFMTDGLCEPGELVPPDLLEPENGSWAESINQSSKVMISWSAIGGCTPKEYHYQVAIDPDFNYIVYTGNVGIPWTFAAIPFDPGQVCTHLFWRVQSRVGNSTSTWSETYDFYYEVGDGCSLVPSPGDGAMITGHVFEDKCPGSLPFESESVTPPTGCVSSQIGIHGDGIWDFAANAEPVIPDIAVDLGLGPCPASASFRSRTDENGFYYFFVEAPGEYCILINTSENPELQDGIFTYPWPATTYYVAWQSVTVTPSDIVEQNFGWDKDEIKLLNFNVKKLSTCRQTDNKNSAAVMYLEEGAVIPVVATNTEKTWFLTRFDCFVSIATGEAEEGDLPLYPEQPIPVVGGQTDPGQTDGIEQKPCSSYTGPRSCVYPRCVWVYPIAGPGYCTESD